MHKRTRGGLTCKSPRGMYMELSRRIWPTAECTNGPAAGSRAKAPAGCMCNLRVELDPDCHLEGAAARRSKFGCFSIRNHIRNVPFWSGPPDPARQVRIAGSGAGARSPPGIFKRCMLISRFFKFFRGFSSCVQLFRDFSK